MTNCWSPGCRAEVAPEAAACSRCGSPLRVRDKYRITRLLGQGGMGVVYEAVDEALGREVALKVMHGRFAAKSKQRERFQTEARAMAALDHPGIARIYDADAHHDQLFFVQQLVRGRPLRDWVAPEASPRLPVSEAVRIAVELLGALEHAHDKGIVHRDVNPNNVLVVERAGVLSPIVIDFGLARTADQAETRVAWGGTPGYAAPEQLLDPASNDRRSDLYAAAAVLHALVTGGRVPYAEVLPKGIGSNPKALLAAYQRIASGAVPFADPRASGAPITPELSGVLELALRPDPAARFQSAREMAAALRPFAAPAADGPSSPAIAALEALPVTEVLPVPPTAAAAAPTAPAERAPSTISALAAPGAPAAAPALPRRTRLVALAGLLVLGGAAAAVVLERPRPSLPASSASSSAAPPPAPAPAAAPELALFAPSGVAIEPNGRVLVADRGNHRILALEGGVLRTLAGSGTRGFADGDAATARFAAPRTMKVAPDGAICVADEGNNRVRLIRGGRVETLAGSGEAGFADGPAASAELDHPAGLSLQSDGSWVVADARNHRIRLIKNGEVTTIAGSGQRGYADGPAAFAKLDNPVSVATGPDGTVYIADSGNLKIRALRAGWVSTVVPMGARHVSVNEPVLSAFDWLPALAVAPDGTLYFGDPDKHRVMVVQGGKARVLAGTGDGGSLDGDAANATFSLPQGLAVGSDGAVYVADAQADRIRVIRDGAVSSLVSSRPGGFVDGKLSEARFARPWGLAFGPGGRLFVADWQNARVRVIDGGEVRTFAGSGQLGFRDGPARDSDFDGLWDIEVAPSGAVYLADGDNNRVRMIEAGAVRTLAGTGEAGWLDGDAARAKLNAPGGVGLGKDGAVYVADTQNHRIRVIENGVVRTLAGTGVAGFENGPANQAMFDRPGAIAVDDQGWVYVADTGNHRIRLLRHGNVSTFAGAGRGFADGEASAARFDSPVSLSLGKRGELYVADTANHRIRVIEDGTTRTLAGAGVDGYADGPAASAWFARPTGVALGPDGAVYVTDSGNHAIRVVRGGVVSTLAGR